MRAILATLALLLLALPALALDPGEALEDPALEARARAISSELRCLVCQNQSIELSDASLAKELRMIVRERIVAGDGDAAVLQFVVDRYGEFVLLRPVFAWHTLVLWIAAPVLLMAGALVLFSRRRRVVDTAPVALSAEEQAALASLESRDRR